MSEQAKHPKLATFKSMGDDTEAVTSKLVKSNVASNGSSRGPGKNRPMTMPQMSLLSKLIGKTASNINDAKNLFQVLPDMDLARQILVSAILSPTDLVSTTLNYTLADNDLDDNLTGPMLREVKEYFEKTYRIKKLLPEMLSDALFMKGSYPMLVLPESTIDQAINSTGRFSMESLKEEIDDHGNFRPLGILGVPDTEGKYTISTESAFTPFNLDDRGKVSSFTVDQFKVKADTITFEAFNSEGKPQKKQLKVKGGITVTDNINVLKSPMLQDTARRHRISEIYGARFGGGRNKTPPGGTTISHEANSTKGGMVQLANALPSAKVSAGKPVGLDRVEQTFYKSRNYAQVPIQPLLTPRQLDRASVGHPLVMHLPAECIIPVHVPGNPRQHVGYYVFLDVHGNPLTIAYRDDYYADVRTSMSQDPDMSSQLLTMNVRGQNGRSDWNNNEIDELQRAYVEIVENDLLNRLRSGMMTGDYELSRVEEVYRLMFSRAMSQKNTICLYVPVELMVYIAFDYNDFGIGKSLLEDGKILGSIRATILFANTMAAVKNAAGTQTITITVPEEDEDPYSTAEFMLGEYAKLNRDAFPIGETHPVDIITHMQNAGKNIVVQGNSAFPEVKFDVEAREGSQKMMDKELDEELRRRHIQMFGLTPETMEASTGADFATTVVNQHLMLLKRVIQYQEDFQPFLEDFHRTYILNSGAILDKLREIVEENSNHLPPEYTKDGTTDTEAFIYDFVMAMEVTLPQPETNRIEDQMRGYETYTTAVTTAVDAFLNQETLETFMGQGLEEHIDSIKKSIVAMYQRKYLREKNILPELDIFNSITEEEGPVFVLLDELREYNDGVLQSIEGYLNLAIETATKRKKTLDEGVKKELDALNGGGDGGFGDDGMGGGDDGMGGGLDDGSGDLGDGGDDMGDDLGGDAGADGMGDDLDALGDEGDLGADGGEAGGDDASLDAELGGDEAADATAEGGDATEGGDESAQALSADADIDLDLGDETPAEGEGDAAATAEEPAAEEPTADADLDLGELETPEASTPEPEAAEAPEVTEPDETTSEPTTTETPDAEVPDVDAGGDELDIDLPDESATPEETDTSAQSEPEIPAETSDADLNLDLDVPAEPETAEPTTEEPVAEEPTSNEPGSPEGRAPQVPAEPKAEDTPIAAEPQPETSDETTAEEEEPAPPAEGSEEELEAQDGTDVPDMPEVPEEPGQEEDKDKDKS